MDLFYGIELGTVYFHILSKSDAIAMHLSWPPSAGRQGLEMILYFYLGLGIGKYKINHRLDTIPSLSITALSFEFR